MGLGLGLGLAVVLDERGGEYLEEVMARVRVRVRPREKAGVRARAGVTLDMSTTLATFSAVTGSDARFVKTTAVAIDWSESDAVVENWRPSALAHACSRRTVGTSKKSATSRLVPFAALARTPSAVLAQFRMYSTRFSMTACGRALGVRARVSVRVHPVDGRARRCLEVPTCCSHQRRSGRGFRAGDDRTSQRASSNPKKPTPHRTVRTGDVTRARLAPKPLTLSLPVSVVLDLVPVAHARSYSSSRATV